jgi:superfamily II DNA or RNA helicase
MNLDELIEDERTSLQPNSVDAAAFARDMDHLTGFNFWNTIDPFPYLWAHQKTAIGTVVAYLNGDKQIPERNDQIEAALLKLPTGTGKSGIISVLARCLPNIRRVLILTPRAALTEQLIADIGYRFWKHMGYTVEEPTLFFGDDEQTGRALERAFIEQLLPSKVRQINEHLSEDNVERVILVGTHQALGAIRKSANDPDRPGSRQCQDILAELRDNFDLVVVDEGHYEPAVSWSRGVRELNLPTLLLSATPYRNDYKSFRVRGRYLFNFPYAQAVEHKIIRPTKIIIPDVGSVAGRQPAVRQFVQLLHQELPTRLTRAANWFRNNTAPKVMVRGDDLETLYMLQAEINQVFETRAVVIHDKATRTPENGDRFTSVSSAQLNRSDATYWIHQNKLMEGIDEPAFVAIGIFDLMANNRQLVQQIGRATRHSQGDSRFRQTGWVIGSPANAARIQTAWTRYEGYEDYAARNTTHIVSNEVTLPDRLLEKMPEYQYIDGEFRGRFEFERPLSSGDIQLPCTAAVLKSVGAIRDVREFGKIVEEAIMDKDRFKVTPIVDLPGNALGFSYYAWRNSPYLIDRFFSEWKLGIFIAVQQNDFVFMHDTEGLVLDMTSLSLRRADRSLMEKIFPEPAEGDNSRLSRMSFSSLDMSQHAIRGMAMRTRSFADVFTDLLDPSLIPATAAGFVNGDARYVGFARSRLRYSSERHIPISDYICWTEEVSAELSNNARNRSRVFERYAAVVENVATNDAQPVSILIDPSLDDMRDDEVGGANFILHEDVDYFDLCADVDDGTGRFIIEIGGQEIPCSVEFVKESGKYHLESDALNELFPAQQRDNRRQGQTLVQRLNQRQSFRILTGLDGVIYSEGSFYEPRAQWSLEDGSKPILDKVFAAPSLENVVSEKGENQFAPNRRNWHRQSIFGLFSAVCDGQYAGEGIPEDDLTRAIDAIPIWLCDDDGQEVADFIGLDPTAKKIILVHAKVGSQGPNGRGFNVGGLQVVGRQALASLGFISLGRPSDSWTPDRWEDLVRANQNTLAGRDRIFRCPDGMTAGEVNEKLRSACRNPSFDKEVWIVGASMTRREVLENGLAENPMQNRLRQFLMHWDAMQTACARANTRMKFFCS